MNYQECKKAYDICKNLGFSKIKINTYCTEFNYEYEVFVFNATYYGKKILKRLLSSISKQEFMFLFQSENLIKIIQKYKKFIEQREIYFKETEPKKIVNELQEQLLSFIEKVHFNELTIKMEFFEWKLDYEEQISLIGRFMINNNYCKDSIKKLNKLTNKVIETKKELLDNVLNSNETDSINLFQKSIQIIHEKDIHSLYDKESEQQDLIKKLTIYKEYKQNHNDKKENDELILSETIVKGFIDSDFEQLSDYCKNLKISISKFNLFLNIVKEKNTSLHETCMNKINYLENKKIEYLILLSKTILDKIKNGILEQGQLREFDLLDYYFITNIDRIIILKTITKYLPEETKNYVSFLRKYLRPTLLTEKQIKLLLNNKQIVDVLVDSKGNPIIGTGREVTIQEKELVINYLKENNIPIIDDVYSIALNRYLKGTLNLEKTFDK